ncbi:hypothetical protein TREMEDRAFT_59883 [Tremella mesenterica DSM 1558]|uniref:uncharacterized protein n=1 Tax=Tremella mesenterica (strain ATCC 24925 / CBS 8224 / DSM 1558 / NBRC 9311 / NRRL Y-6157 / RJB 2259-6 / UBC 559-6) TaxID=578456 RepID=UPI0003F49447|nr:uncharacterized protein TREMEDRAFT_59883 [Tremella mesenterica DSM 1558]EIW73710.1 hypothetical protein TREMEDRAFT_59883 [Tremella mesenterica DSM 1558]
MEAVSNSESCRPMSETSYEHQVQFGEKKVSTWGKVRRWIRSTLDCHYYKFKDNEKFRRCLWLGRKHLMVVRASEVTVGVMQFCLLATLVVVSILNLFLYRIRSDIAQVKELDPGYYLTDERRRWDADVDADADSYLSRRREILVLWSIRIFQLTLFSPGGSMIPRTKGFRRKIRNKPEPSHPKEQPSPTPHPVTAIASTHHPSVEAVQPEIQNTASEADPEIDHKAEIQQHQYCAAYAYTMLRPAVPPKAST